MKTVVVIEDQTTFRDLICHWVETHTGMKVIGQAGDGEEGYAMCCDLQPDVLILDIILPTLNGTEVLERLQRKKLKTQTLVFTGLVDDNSISRLLKLGAMGILNKTARLTDLTKAIETVSSGSAYYSPDVLDAMCRIMQRGNMDKDKSLTVRERQIIQLIANSFTNKDIADKLDTSVRTIDTHRNNIMRKLDIHDTAALTRWAIANHMIDASLETIPNS